MALWIGLFVGFGWGSAAGSVTIDWVPVIDPGNNADSEVMTCCPGDGTSGYGSVDSAYRISKHEVTNSQYVEFLNAVAATDTHGLYNVSMNGGSFGGISRIGAPGSYSYSLIPGHESRPVNWVSQYDALRFTNWLHNAQPTGVQDATTTEGGAYAITPEAIASNSIDRNANANIFLPSEDEWYKAAYYDPVSSGYFDYAAGSDVKTTCTTPGPATNTGNCYGCAGCGDEGCA